DEVLLNARESDSVKTMQSRAIVEHITPYMSLADLASVNLETQIAQGEPEQRASKFVTFFSRPQTLDALAWAGIDYVSLGNNHTYDYLKSGLASTMTFLQDSSLGFSGAGFNQQQALKAYRTQLNDTSLSLLGYVGWEGSSQPTQTATDDHGGAAYGSMANILASVDREVQQNRVTILQYHGSQEYANNPTGVTEQRLKSGLDAGAALAIAHHPHVTQGIELYDGKLIAYSMGNFIFDQNFSATQHSFILYVWMDEGKFSRAEIVPLYIKGYKPTPATGMHRHTLMKRLTSLSGARGTVISRSGGHGVITSQNQTITQPKVDHKVQLAVNERTASLYHLPWERQLTQIEGLKGRKYRLGVNLINGSDFESFASFDSRERGWLYDKSAVALNDYGYSGQHSLALILAPSKPALFGMQSFRRVYSASQPMTIKARIKTGQKVRARFYWQGRKNRQKLMAALQNGEKHLIATKEVNSDADWQSVEVDFNSPRVGFRGYRILVEFELLEGTLNTPSSQIDIDDFALIEWQTAYSARPEPALLSDKSRVVTYIGLDKPSVEPLTLTLL
ncbi:MAG: CapA family protein, partial [Psychrosphaera sp.]|nr:CapA family protein [Psychrosphaera sp.]